MKIIIVTGPSGVGKSRPIRELASLGVYPLEVYTDRLRRPTEDQETDRVYLTAEEFDLVLGDFIYWFEFQGSRYGYKKADIEKQKLAGKSVCFNIPPSFLPEILDKLPEATVVYLHAEEKDFNLLFDRMIARDLSDLDSESVKTAKINKIKQRLDFAKRELDQFEALKKAVFRNSLSRVFEISDDEALYRQVIPYLKKIVG